MEHSGVMEILCTLIGVWITSVYTFVNTRHTAHFRFGILLDVNASLKKKKQSQKKLVQDLHVLGNLRGTF